MLLLHAQCIHHQRPDVYRENIVAVATNIGLDYINHYELLSDKLQKMEGEKEILQHIVEKHITHYLDPMLLDHYQTYKNIRGAKEISIILYKGFISSFNNLQKIM